MTDERRAYAPTPHLRTRPATMLTGICLCVIIVLIQFVPGFPTPASRVAQPVSIAGQ